MKKKNYLPKGKDYISRVERLHDLADCTMHVDKALHFSKVIQNLTTLLDDTRYLNWPNQLPNVNCQKQQQNQLRFCLKVQKPSSCGAVGGGGGGGQSLCDPTRHPWLVQLMLKCNLWQILPKTRMFLCGLYFHPFYFSFQPVFIYFDLFPERYTLDLALE